MQIERKGLHDSIEAVKKRGVIFYLVMAGVLCLAAERSPAPIVEAPDTPTPAPQQQQETSAPKEKHATKPRPQSFTTVKEQHQPAAASGPARFSGNWSGRLPQPFQGMVAVSLFVNAEGTSVRMKEGERPAVVSGNTITWKSGWLNEITWTLTPEKGGTTALVTSKSGFGVNGTATFTRTQSPVVSSAPNQSITKPPTSNPPNIPTAKQVPGRPGFVYNPYDPKPDAIFDARNQAHGATVRDPASGKLFVIP